MEDLETLLELPDDQLLERLGADLWKDSAHATPPTPPALRAEARAWLKQNLPRARQALCGNEAVEAIRKNADVVTLVGGIADIFASVVGFPAPSVVAILVARIGLDRLCGKTPASTTP